MKEKTSLGWEQGAGREDKGVEDSLIIQPKDRVPDGIDKYKIMMPSSTHLPTQKIIQILKSLKNSIEMLQ